jgi:hypothetical protein
VRITLLLHRLGGNKIQLSALGEVHLAKRRRSHQNKHAFANQPTHSHLGTSKGQEIIVCVRVRELHLISLANDVTPAAASVQIVVAAVIKIIIELNLAAV